MFAKIKKKFIYLAEKVYVINTESSGFRVKVKKKFISTKTEN